MADKKISQLSAASTPLAGTEVLPIVQSSATVKVASNDLTVRNIRANATTGILQVTGPAAASTRVMTVPDANFTVARTDAANSFTGDQTLATGDIIQGTAGKGFNFSANTSQAGMTSELLNWYEAGTWTPSQGSGWSVSGTFSSSGQYTRVGRLVVARARFAATTSLTVGSFGILCNNIPFGAPIADFDATIWVAGTSYRGIYSVDTNFYSFSAFTATAPDDVVFVLTYFV